MAASSSYSAANNAFAMSLLHVLESGKADENLFISPFSITSALLMTMEGARRETAAEMGQALQFSEELYTHDAATPWDLVRVRHDLQAAYQRLQIAATPPAEDATPPLPQLHVANALWVEKTLPVDPQFLKTLTESYASADAKAADFKQNSERERIAINQWVSDQTRGKITDLIPPPAISRLTRMVLANAVYFWGAWANPFEQPATEGEFHTSQGPQSTLMMAQSIHGGRYGAFHPDGSPFATPATLPRNANPADADPPAKGFQIMDLPYAGGEISMQLLLPGRDSKLAALAKLLTRDRLREWDRALQRRECFVRIPKFQFESSHQLNEPLQQLGMVRAFRDQPGIADFSGMCSSTDPDHQLYVSAVIHKAYLEVNEKGTEAAAATAVVMARATAAFPSGYVPQFVADRPFYFLIRHRSSDTILFLGKLTHPA